MTAAAFYKNIETSLKVGKRLQTTCKRPVLLVRFGRSVPEWDGAVREAGMENRVVTLPHVPPSAMCDIYNSVDCLLFPSWYEGLGLPPIEAMACGTPSVTSNAGALPEVVGDAAPTAAPNDVDGLARLVQTMLDDADRRVTWIERGLRHATKFSWERHAEHVLQVYRDVLEEADQ
jgi:glycosyltransferase involved in cell wall biosynthesis